MGFGFWVVLGMCAGKAGMGRMGWGLGRFVARSVFSERRAETGLVGTFLWFPSFSHLASFLALCADREFLLHVF